MNIQVKLIQVKNILNKLAMNRIRLRILLFASFAFLILFAGLMFFALSIGKPFTGVVLSLNGGGAWAVESVDPNGAAYQAGIRIGDIPTEINYQPAQTFLEKYNNVGFVYGLAVSELVVIDQTGHTKFVDLKDSSPTLNSLIEISSWLFTSIIFWIVGLYVFIKKPLNYATCLLCLCSLFFGLTLGATQATDKGIPLATQFAVFALAVSPYLLLHFFLVLPDERTKLRNNPLIYLIYLPAIMTAVLFPFIGYADGQPLPLFRSIRLIEFMLVLLVVAGVAVYNYLRAVSPRTRQQMKIMLISSILALVPFLIISLMFSVIFKQNSVIYGIQMLFASFIPVGMGYAVVTQKLLDIDVVIRRGVIYGIITIVIAIILVIGIFLAITFQKTIGFPEEIIIALVLGVVATLLFGPAKKGAEYVVDRLLYKDRYDYRKIIQTLNDSLNRLNDFNDISRLIVSLTVNTLNLAGACLFVKPQSGTLEVRAVQGIFDNAEKQVRLMNLIDKSFPMMEFPNSAATVDSDVAFLIPLTTGEKEVGFLCISPKSTRQGFSDDDIYLLQGIASVSASALRNAMLVYDVSLRNTFVSIASHELRTPLTSIIGFADLLLWKNPPEETRKTWAKYVFDAAGKLAAIVDDLLNVTRIQSGKTKFKIEATDLYYILEEQLEMVQQSTDKHEFIVNIEPDLPRALVDRDKFGHVVLNLLTNAIKYSPNGGHITISASFDPELNRIIVVVADEGMGISSVDGESLFTTFHRIQRPETMGISGSGLGLYIAKEWTEAMGGDIWLQSELNKGSKFFIGIPAQKSEGNN